MVQQIVELVRAMSTEVWDEKLLEQVCQMAMEQLERELRPGVTAADCGGAFPVAAAWMALAALEECGQNAGVESFSAGGLSIRTRSGGGSLRQQARQLMAPYCRLRDFAFQGVRG